MPIRKDKKSGVWFLDISTPGGQRIRRSTGTKDKQAAQEYHDRLSADLWRQRVLGEEPDHTFEEAAVCLLREAQGQSDYATKIRHIAYWRSKFAGRAVRSLTAAEIVDALPTHRLSRYGAPQVVTNLRVVRCRGDFDRQHDRLADQRIQELGETNSLPGPQQSMAVLADNHCRNVELGDAGQLDRQ